MIRRVKHGNGFRWRFVSTEGSRRALSVILAVALTLSTIPAVAVRAFAEEITPGLEVVAEAVGDMLEDLAPEENAVPAEEPAAEPAPAEEPAAEPVADSEPKPETLPGQEVAPAAELDVSTLVKGWQPPTQTVTVPRANEPMRAEGDPLSLGVAYSADDVSVDGVYQERNVTLFVTGNDVDLDDALLGVTRNTKDGYSRTTFAEFTVVGKSGNTTELSFKVTDPGTYVKFMIIGGTCTVDGETVQANSTLELPEESQFEVAGDFGIFVALLDAEGNLMVDDEDKVINVADATPENPVGQDAAAIAVYLDVAALDMSKPDGVAKSAVRLYGPDGACVLYQPFEYDPEHEIYQAIITHLDSTTLDYIADGVYGISIVAVDLFGNVLVDAEGNEYVLIAATLVEQEDGEKQVIPDGSLVIDSGSPITQVRYPRDQKVSTYTPTGATAEYVADVPEKIDFFNQDIVLRIYISDSNLDFDNTLLLGVPFKNVIANPTTAIPGVSCEITEDQTHAGAAEYTIKATCGDGLYDVSNLVVAKDTMEGHEAAEVEFIDGNGDTPDITHFVVDTTAPQITAATLGSTPYDLGNDADGNAIVNGADNNGNRVFFVEAGSSSIALTVNEPYGIRSIEFGDATNTYTNQFGDVSSIIDGENATLTGSSHTGTYDLTVINGLIEGVPFDDGMLFVITDFAGNQYYWSMSEQGWTGTYDKDLLTPVTATDLTDGSGNAMNHPTLLVPDETGPEIALEGPEDRTDPTKPEYKRVYQDAQDVVLNLVDSSIAYLQGFEGGDATYDPNGFINGTFAGLDPNRVVLTIDYTSDDGSPSTYEITLADLEPWSSDNETFGWDYTCDLDGDYEISADFSDVTGQNVNATIEKFTIDTVNPVIDVTYEPDDSHASQSFFYNEPIKATITVAERNFDSDLFTVTATAGNGAADLTDPTVSAWTDNGDNTHTCTVTFDADGSYHITVNGMDNAGNGANNIDDGPFIIDREAPAIAKYYANGTAPAASFDADDPVVEIPAATGTYDDGSGITYYFTHGIDVEAKVQDRNFDVDGTQLFVTKDGAESERTVEWDGSTSATGPNGRVLWTTTVPYTEDGEYFAPHVISSDAAGNTSDNSADASAMRLVVDLNPPELSVNVNRTPSAQGMTGGDPVNFYNQVTTMTFTVDDAHLLRSVEVVDPDGLYNISKSDASAEGKGSVTLTLTLRDGSGTQDGEFDRDITLTAVDLAGNSRTWNISRTGRITQDSVTSGTTNVGINGGTEYPIALIQDTVAPVVSLSGVTAGTYYNSPQEVLATVAEYNMEYLQQFDGGRVVVTITNWSADASRTQSTMTINANQFSGSRPNYSYTQRFATDGHYALTAQFEDFAGNMSNQVSIGEFTIDMTDPQISISWDNEDARSGNYYKATRTATITVVEHNFDASRFTIDTTGTLGSWVDNGDTHTITVYFGEGSAHTLAVSGSDLAGNEANPVSVEPFIVDLTAPEISISGLAQRLGFLDDDDPDSLVDAYLGELKDYNAYNGVVIPTITYTDNETLSEEDLTFTVVGNKNGADLEFETSTTEEAPEMTTTFGDIGYVGPDAGDGSNAGEFYVDDYDPNADDIYTLTATMLDRAGNEAEAKIVFSVNRYGSNYIVSLDGLNPSEEAEYNTSGMLSAAPTIVVHEINVCGVDEDSHHVQKEFANVTSAIEQSGGSGAGYDLVTVENKDQEVGWSEYVYTIRSANFGEGSDSDNNDRGQGTYRVNVMSDDYSSNANSTAAFWSSDAARRAVTAEGATTEFILDELAPIIDDLNLPEHFSAGESFEASFHVTDDITSGNKVQVFVDGEELAASEVRGSDGGVGTYTFTIPARAFDWGRSIRILVTDYAGREVEATNGEWLWQSTFIPEGLAAAGVVAVGITAAVVAHKRKAAQEPELPE